MLARCWCLLVLAGCGEPTKHAPNGSPTPTDEVSSVASTTALATGTTGAAGVGSGDAAGPAGADSGAVGGVSNTTTGQGGVTGTGGTSSTRGGSAGTSITSGTGAAATGGTLVTASATGAGGSGGTGGAGGTGNPVIDAGSEGDGRFELSAPYDPVNMEVRNGPHGSVYDLTMRSEDSSIYPGLNGPYSRRVQVYVPEQYQDGTLAPFMVVQDGPSHTGKIQRALDNLIADGGAPALVAIMVDNGGGDSIGSERGLEYDTLSDTYSRFVETEVLPTVLSDRGIAADYPNFALTDDPEGRAAMGCSSGASAAFTMAWFGNDSYRRVLSYSGTFVDQQDPAVSSYPNGAWEYHEHLIDDSPLKPLRVYLHVGGHDLGYDAPEAGLHNWVLANERMFEALDRKGYHVHFDFALGSGHCDGSVVDHTLYDALKWLWRGYRTE